MNKARRPIICVVAAEANSIEQRQILYGIIEKAQEYGYDTAVISNIYNPNVSINSLACENKIYELIQSEDIAAMIMIAESFVNEEIRQNIADLMLKKDIPMIILGAYLEEFSDSRFTFINTSDENDTIAMIDHLIDVHGFTDIDFLSGYEYINVSQKRAEGYRMAMRKHGLPVDEKKIHFGDFWMDSGKALAERYINGTLPMPQAVACANDYMAYGMLDTFSRNGIKVPEDITVIGYEYIDKRLMHTPLLTTYQRNRADLGRQAVDYIHSCLNDTAIPEFTPPEGNFVLGDSCPCGRDNQKYLEELEAVKIKKDFEFWNLFSSLDQEITESKNLSEFVTILGKFHWLLRDVYDIILCLYTDWYDPENEISDIVTCRQVMPWLDNSPFELHRFDFAEIFSRCQTPAAYYFNPIFFGQRMFGHIILRYDHPDTYDDIFRNWIKSISICLEFLRMKNDIRYLTSCQNLSDQRDTLTGMYNAFGLEKAYSSAVLHGNREMYFIMLKICLFDESIAISNADDKIKAILDASRALDEFSGNHDICGRINDNTLVCIVQRSAETEMIADCVSSILLQHKKYMNYCGTDSFVCITEKCSGMPYNEIYEKCTAAADKRIKEMAEKKLIGHYNEMADIRTYIYNHPDETFGSESLHELFPGSTGYLRSVFKQCFDISFHKDCIVARIAKAKYYLSTTTLNVVEISEKCGYLDSKYFLRQFSSVVGMTPIQYRTSILN
ncbi:MAG: substrate-binding domain-containing protein [Ruminococcus sp.]|nr:substrate-binding domain-containing protein [Ruminococcus sp.]